MEDHNITALDKDIPHLQRKQVTGSGISGCATCISYQQFTKGLAEICTEGKILRRKKNLSCHIFSQEKFNFNVDFFLRFSFLFLKSGGKEVVKTHSKVKK